MEKQLSFRLESFSTGILKNKASGKNHLSSKGQKEPKQSVNGLLSSKKKEFKLKSLSLDELKQPLKESEFFDNQIHKLLSTKEASGLLGVSENALEKNKGGKQMLLKTILNDCCKFKSFVYVETYFSEDRKSIEVLIKPRKNGKSLCEYRKNKGPLFFLYSSLLLF